MLIVYHLGTDQLKIGFSYLKKTETEMIAPRIFIPDKFHLWYKGYKRGFFTGVKMNIPAVWIKVISHFILVHFITAYLSDGGKSL